MNSYCFNVYLCVQSAHYMPYIPSLGKFNCLHMTMASLLSQPASVMSPHKLSRQISTVPALLTGPPTKRTAPSVQPKTYEHRYQCIPF